VPIYFDFKKATCYLVFGLLQCGKAHCPAEDAAVVLDHLVVLEIDAHQSVRAEHPVAPAEKAYPRQVTVQMVI